MPFTSTCTLDTTTRKFRLVHNENLQTVVSHVEDLEDVLNLIDEEPIARHGAYDLYKGRYYSLEISFLVFIKVLRGPSNTPHECQNLIAKVHGEVHGQSIAEAVSPHTVPILGLLQAEHTPIPSIITPAYFQNAFIYLRFFPETSRRLVAQLASTLKTLHENVPWVAHGNLRSENLLIDGDDIRLDDFSLSHISGDPTFDPDRSGACPRYMSPELHNDNEAVTPASDVWAFGMTVLHLVSGMVPFYYIEFIPKLIFLLSNGETPKREKYPTVSDKLWAVLVLCWKEVGERPSIGYILLRLEELDKGDFLKIDVGLVRIR